MTRDKSQLNLPVTPLRKMADSEPERKNSEPDGVIRAASVLFDQALHDACVTNQEASHLMGVSESLVHKMRSPDYRECVSLVQLLRCGPMVVWKFHCALHAKEQFGQRALREAMQALSLLAVGIE